MGLRTLEHTIPARGERPARVVTITELSVAKGRPVFARLVGKLPSKVRNTEGGNEDAAMAEYAIQLVQAAAGEMEYLVGVFGASSMVDGARVLSDPAIQDDLFGGAYDELLRWLWACASLNFGSLAGLVPSGGKELAGALLELAREKVSATSRSPAPSTGTSGASSVASGSEPPSSK